ncbi:MAG: helix-turn-helix domain-containing protein [Bacteroidetes bacterium]|nr:helix-turn-helix domain-containing protein [Bacteroidota bacterium]
MNKKLEQRITTQHSPIENNFEKPLTLIEAAAFIGVSKSCLYKMTHKNQITYYKPNGKMIYFTREELTNWVLRNRIQTKDELEARAVEHVTNNK